ncbi:MAG TPA: DUF4399 domain-containing protein [Chitinophagaceae bacterium]|nr:DUF4399 domain-containing protein [Chitinophagaceae bacterium]
MIRKIFIPAACLLLAAACNNASNEAPKSADTTTAATGQDTAHHMPMTGATVPELPAIPAGAKVFFKNLKPGATVTSPFKVQMGAEGIRVDTAGPVVAGSGHHHLFIDAEDSLAAGTVVPKDSTHLHFGKAQTETELTLAPGKHKLTLQFADGAHRSYGGKLSATVTVNVKK